MGYGQCVLANLFGSSKSRTGQYKMVHWYTFRGFASRLKKLTLKIGMIKPLVYTHGGDSPIGNYFPLFMLLFLTSLKVSRRSRKTSRMRH